MTKCSVCKTEIDDFEAYEYRGAIACEAHFDELIERRDTQRSEIIWEESAKTEPMKGFDFGDNPVGKANREIFRGRIEFASKESSRLKEYEGRD